MKHVIITILLLATPVMAEPHKPDPTFRALGQMLMEAQQREATANIKVQQLDDALAAEKTRADAAEKALADYKTAHPDTSKP